MNLGHARHVAIAALISTLSVLPARALPPAHLWSHSAGSTGTDEAYGLALDAALSAYIVGGFQGTIDLGGGPLTSVGGTDIFIAKYDSSGVYKWGHRFGSAGDDFAYDVHVDQFANIWIIGYFAGQMSLGGSTLLPVGTTDVFFAKFRNSDGVHLFSHRFGGDEADLGYGISTFFNDFLTTGSFTGMISGYFGSAGEHDIFLARWTPQVPSGYLHVWSRRFGGTGMDIGRDVLYDYATQGLLITGSFETTVDFGGGPRVSAGGSDMFLARFSNTGVHEWSQRFGTGGNEIGYGIATHPSGYLFATGVIENPLTYLRKFASDGSTIWSKQYGVFGSGSLISYAVATDSKSNVLVTGSATGVIDFGGELLGGLGNDIFLVKFDSDGNYIWGLRFGSVPGISGAGYGIAANNPGGNVTIAGYFIGDTDFGGGVLENQGIRDIFVARYSAETAVPQITSISDIGNDQGRLVKVRFDRSGYDTYPALIDHYEVYRKDAAPPAMSYAGDRERAITGWTEVGRVDAHGDRTYGVDVPTIGDSTVALGPYHSTFRIRAATDDRLRFYDSPPDSGYSLDNLSPGVPQNLVYDAGQLGWDESPASDFDYFTVYGSADDEFATATVVNYTVSPALNVTLSPYAYYFVTATDFSGNEGNAATVNAPSGVGETPRVYVLSVTNFPNPFNPRTTLRYTLPSRGPVSVVIHDTRGARVRVLVLESTKDAGAYTAEWDGRDDAGEMVSSGVYFARIEHAGASRSRKLTLIK